MVTVKDVLLEQDFLSILVKLVEKVIVSNVTVEYLIALNVLEDTF